MKSLVFVFIVALIFFDISCNRSSVTDKSSEIVFFEKSKNLPADFLSPPDYARPRVFWWWLEGNISKKGILRDLCEMKDKGIGGAMIFDAGSSSYSSVRRSKAGLSFMSDEWIEVAGYALHIADSLGLELSFNITSGWNDGGPWVTPDMASKKLVWSEIEREGPVQLDEGLPLPDNLMETGKTPYFIPVKTLAFKIHRDDVWPIKHHKIKSVHEKLHSSKNKMYNWEIFLEEYDETPGEYHAAIRDVIDISEYVDETGRLKYNLPDGKYSILRMGYTGTGARVSTNSPGGGGLAIDYLKKEATDLQFSKTVEVIREKFGESGARAMKFIHDDSWELGAANWSDDLIPFFIKLHGYDPVPFLPVLTGKIIESRSVSNRFLYDFRRTIADMIYQNHYVRLSERAHKYNIGFHPESGGPHPAPIDALKNLGVNDIPMGEFWVRAETHRVEDYRRLFVKQSACAAHIYGKRFVQAEGPTSIGPHWEKTPFDMKPTIDREFCEGLNRMVFHTFTHSPEDEGIPGIEYFAGTHFNPNITYWRVAGSFIDYISRCQLLLSQGRFVGDVCFYYGDNVPNQVMYKAYNPGLGYGYDYDMVNTEVLLSRMSVKEGRIVLPDGMSYQLLVLPDREAMPLDVVKKIEQLVAEGATVIGSKPLKSTGLKGYPESDAELKEIADRLWADIDGKEVFENNYKKGRVIWGKTIRSVLAEKGIGPDFEFKSDNPESAIDYIHRSFEPYEIYFVANRNNTSEQLNVSFRVNGKRPRLWFPQTGKIKEIPDVSISGSRVSFPLSVSPYGSVFVVFSDREIDRSDSVERIFFNEERVAGKENFCTSSNPVMCWSESVDKWLVKKDGKYLVEKEGGRRIEKTVTGLKPSVDISNNWDVSFDTIWGGPDNILFDSLVSWHSHKLGGIKYYSGEAKYKRKVKIDSSIFDEGQRVFINLGEVRDLAEISVNGEVVRIVWAEPYSTEITPLLKAGVNSISISVFNMWPNRIIGDELLDPAERFTRTNVIKFNKDYPLRASGLLGPVRLEFAKEINFGEQ